MDDLEKFLAWFLEHGTTIGAVPLLGATNSIDGVSSVIWFRSGQFQVQLFVVPPNHIIPEHIHPNVDSFEVYVGGQIRFSHGGKYVVPEDALTDPSESGCSKYRGYTIRVRPNDAHGGTFGPGGGVFFSVQHWLNGVKPHCVAADYTGPVTGPGHLSQVKAGSPVLKPSLSAADAATLEDHAFS